VQAYEKAKHETAGADAYLVHYLHPHGEAHPATSIQDMRLLIQHFILFKGQTNRNNPIHLMHGAAYS
jgi:hypothetical protein